MLRDLIVHLEGNKEDKVRLAYAELLAVRHDAFITGLFSNIVPDNVYSAGYGSMLAAQSASQMQETAMKNGDKAEKKLKKMLDKLSAKTELRRLDVSFSIAPQKVSAETRTSDLMIATRPYNHHSAAPELLEAVLFNSGRAVFFAPPAIMPNGEIDHCVVAWRNTRESSRAVSQAMPILTKAKKVTIALIAEEGSKEFEKAMPGADIARHLDRHGVNVQIRQITEWSNPAEALLNEMARIDGKLLVMGGYGHSRFRELVLGGVTRDVLKNSEFPVLMSH